MDVREFTDGSPGKLVEDANHPDRRAFVPGPIPTVNTLDLGRIANALAEAENDVGRLSELTQNFDDPTVFTEPYLKLESVRSGEIEGTQTTLEDLVRAELLNETETRDDKEVRNYRYALRRALSTDEPITGELIQQLHQWLFNEVEGADGPIGRYRDQQNYIGTRYTPPPPDRVPSLMEDLVEFIQRDDDDLRPLVKIALIHYQFEAIHPFADGNGRIGRMLIVLLTDRYDVLDYPFLYLSEFFTQRRQDYIYYLHRVNTHGNYEDWIEFFLNGVSMQATETVAKLKELEQARQDFLKATDLQSRRVHDLIDLVIREQELTTNSVAEEMKTNRSNAYNWLEQLTEDGVLVRQGGGPGRGNEALYRCERILDILKETRIPEEADNPA